MSKKDYTRKEVKELLIEFHEDFAANTGTEDLRDDWIKENL